MPPATGQTASGRSACSILCGVCVCLYGVCVVYVCTGPQCSVWSVQQQDVKIQLLTALQAPNAVIGLYNSVLDHLALALTSPALQDISWPAPELQHTAAKLDGKENGSAVPAPAFRILSRILAAGANGVIRMACFWPLSCLFVLLCVQGFVHMMCFLNRSTFCDQTWSHSYASKQPVPHRVVPEKNIHR